MITKTKRGFFIVYLLFFAIWLGAAFHDSFSTNFAWYHDPMVYIKFTTENAIPGIINPWPLSTILFLLSTLVALFLLTKYKGPGKKGAFISVCGALAIIIATLIYFVPGLSKIFGHTNEYSQASLVAMSRTWILLNILRFIMLVFLFLAGLRALAKFC